MGSGGSRDDNDPDGQPSSRGADRRGKLMSIDQDGFGRSSTSASGAMRHSAASGSSIHLFAALLLLSVSARAQDAPNPPIELADIANGEGGFQLAADGLPSVGRCSI